MPSVLTTTACRALLGVALLAPGWRPAAAEAEIVTLAEVRPGQRGYGLSVFRGDRPERFEVEVLGIWQNVGPQTSYILARLSGQQLETSGVIAGMSGSPVYLEERLAGAVAFAWPFSHEAIAGITPIESMRRLYAGGGREAPPRAAPPASLQQIAAAGIPAGLLEAGLARLRTQVVERGGSSVVWNSVGFVADTRERLASGLGGVVPAGAADAPAAEPVPGGSISGVLIDGDLRLAATGTVTDRTGDRLLAFGHALFGIGDLQLPMATSEVVTVLSSQFSSFKIANLGSVVGAFELDRSPGIRGRLGAEAPMAPLRLEIRGAASASYDLRLAEVPLLLPTLAAISVLGGLDAATQASGAQSLDLAARFDLGPHGELALRQSFDGDGAALEAAVYVLAVTGFLVNNPMAEARLSSLEVDLEQFGAPRLARLVEAHASRTVVQPGERIALNVDLQAYRGARLRESLEINLPTGLPDGRYTLLVGDGVSIDGARLAVERSAPVSFHQALELLRGLHSRRQLVVLGVFGGRGLAVAGETLPQLPGSLRSIWQAAGAGAARPLRLAVAQQLERQLAMPAEGLLRVDLEVRRREPMAPAAGGSDAGEQPTAERAGDGGGEER